MVQRMPRTLVAVGLIGALALAGCSKDDGGDAASTTTVAVTTTAGGGATTEVAPTATTGGAGTTAATTPTAEAGGGPATTDPATPRPGDTTLSGSVGGTDSTGAISFSKGPDALRSFEVKGLEVECDPIQGTAEGETRTIDLKIPSVPIGADGSVYYVAKTGYQPQLEGSFDAQGRFNGGLIVSYDDGGLRCGGEWGFVAGR